MNSEIDHNSRTSIVEDQKLGLVPAIETHFSKAMTDRSESDDFPRFKEIPVTIAEAICNDSDVFVAAFDEIRDQLAGLFSLTSASAPGLIFVGAKVEATTVTPKGPEVVAMDAGGVGLDLGTAIRSCLGEAIERLSQLRRGDEAFSNERLQHGRELLPKPWQDQLREIQQALSIPDEHRLEWLAGKSLADSRQVLLPADWCLRRPDATFAIPGKALSTGGAAGLTLDDARMRAVLELVERDAAALWWRGGRPGRQVAAESAAALEASELLGQLRQGRARRQSWLLDITTDIQVPVVAAISVDRDGRGLSCGLAARGTLEDAAKSATLEMCQMELGLALARAKQREAPQFLTELDRRTLNRAEVISTDECALLFPQRSPFPGEAVGVGSLADLRNCLAQNGIDVVLFDLTAERFGTPVAYALSPQLAQFAENDHGGRLAQMRDSYGGGDTWTKGASLM